MNHLDDTQKQTARTALQHFKNGLDNLRVLAAEVGGVAGTNLEDGLKQIESGLRTAKHGMVSDQSFDPTAELRGPYQNTYQAGSATGARTVETVDPNVFPDEAKPAQAPTGAQPGQQPNQPEQQPK